MKRLLPVLCLGLAIASPALARAPEAVPLSRPFKVRVLAQGGGFSVDLPPDATSLIVFAEAVAGTSQLNGYVVWKDRQTNDGAFVYMQESVTPL